MSYVLIVKMYRNTILLYVNVKVVVGGYLSKGKQSWACYGAALNKHNHQKNTLGC